MTLHNLQHFIHDNPDYLSQLKKKRFKIRSYKGLKIISSPYNQVIDFEYSQYLRGLVVNKENKIVCIPPQKAIKVDEIDGSDDGVMVYEELIDGTMINLFHANDEWIISTRTEIGGYNKWGHNKSFKMLFDESRDFRYEDLNKDYCYSFVMRHVDNRNIAPIEKNELYIVEMYQIKDGSMNRVMYEDYPEYFLKVDRVEGKNQMIDLLNRSTYLKGYTLKMDDKRYKIENSSFEAIKKIFVNKNHVCLTYLELRKNGTLTEYLKYFPEKSKIFEEYRNKVHVLSNDIYSTYRDVFIYKKMEKNKISYHIKPFVYEIHKKYLSSKSPIKWGDIKDYVYNLECERIYFSLNHSNY
jgi:hypothetical protein